MAAPVINRVDHLWILHRINQLDKSCLWKTDSVSRHACAARRKALRERYAALWEYPQTFPQPSGLPSEAESSAVYGPLCGAGRLSERSARGVWKSALTGAEKSP